MIARVWSSAWSLLVLANLFWAGNIIVGRAVLADVPAVALSFWRWAGAFLVSVPFAWPHLKADWPELRDQWKLMAILAATGIAFFNTAAYIGLAGTTALNVLILQSWMPLVVILWALVLFRERPTFWQLAGTAVSLAGVAFVAARGSVAAILGLRFQVADLWIVAATFIYGIYVVMLRRRPNVHPLSFLVSALGLGACMVAPLYLFSSGAGSPRMWHPGSYAGIVYMAIFPSFIAYLFFNRAVHLIGGARAGQSTHLMPVFGSVMAVAFLGEELHLFHLVGAMLTGGGLLLAHRKPVPPTG